MRTFFEEVTWHNLEVIDPKNALLFICVSGDHKYERMA